IAGVAEISPQLIVPMVVDGQAVNVIVFDPAHDSSILTWLEKHQSGPFTPDDVFVGGRLGGQLGRQLNVCGMPMTVYGQLGKTGIEPFDDSYFLTFDALLQIISICRGSAAGFRSEAGTAHHGDSRICPVGQLPERVSAFLLQLSPDARVDEVKLLLAELPNIQ